MHITDYLKCPLPLGWSLSNLALAAVEYKPATYVYVHKAFACFCIMFADYLKCPLPLGWSLSNLALAAVEHKPALVAAGQWELLLNITKWGADWLIKGHVMASDTPSGNAFVGQVGTHFCCFCIRYRT